MKCKSYLSLFNSLAHVCLLIDPILCYITLWKKSAKTCKHTAVERESDNAAAGFFYINEKKIVVYCTVHKFTNENSLIGYLLRPNEIENHKTGTRQRHKNWRNVSETTATAAAATATAAATKKVWKRKRNLSNVLLLLLHWVRHMRIDFHLSKWLQLLFKSFNTRK